MLESPKTAYLLQYSKDGCQAACAFCSQSKFASANKTLLSRVSWPIIEVNKVVEKITENEDSFRRICIQNVLKPRFQEEMMDILEKFKQQSITLPISICTTPVSKTVLRTLKRLGVDYIGVGLDGASPRILRAVKKPYSWSIYWDFIEKSVEVFGHRKVNVHLIFGLGESEKEFAKTMEKIYNTGAEVALFPFTPISGTFMEKRLMPHVDRYRIMQILRFLFSEGYDLKEACEDKEDGKIYIQNVKWVKNSEKIFLTSGCPSCNRPFYNERPKMIYNYPSVKLLLNDLNLLHDQSKSFGFSPQ